MELSVFLSLIWNSSEILIITSLLNCVITRIMITLIKLI